MQFVLTLPSISNLPVYKQVSEALRQAILSGRLKPGEKLPSTRDLADSVNVSRFTVIRSYEELASQGYIQTISGSGTFVNRQIPKEIAHTSQGNGDGPSEPRSLDPIRLSEYGNRIEHNSQIESATKELFPALNYGAPTLDQLPLSRWREVLNKSSRFQDHSVLSYTGEPFGYLPLREAICGYLTRSRSVHCSAEQIAIFSGSQSAFDLLVRVLLNSGDTVAVENPGFPGARRTFAMHGIGVYPVPVDNQGLVVERLYDCEEPIRLVYVTPSHQDPTSVVMSLPRRLELLKWADRNKALIIEDDYDSEYRYGEKPVPSLQGLDDGDRVIYISTFWKVLYPVVRLGFIVLPKRLVSVMERAKSLVERDFPLLEQRALTDFINEGHLERHIRRTRALYAKRRAALVQALTRCFRKKVSISDASGGMHLLVTFSPELMQNLDRAAVSARVPLVSTEGHYVRDCRPGEFLIGFAHGEEEAIHETIERFARALEEASV